MGGTRPPHIVRERMKEKMKTRDVDVPWGSNEWCSFCGARPGQTSDRTGRTTTAIYACSKCNRNYCDQCSARGHSPEVAECLRCDSEMKRVASQLAPDHKQ